jgi:hypothetical protein
VTSPGQIHASHNSVGICPGSVMVCTTGNPSGPTMVRVTVGPTGGPLPPFMGNQALGITQK